MAYHHYGINTSIATRVPILKPRDDKPSFHRVQLVLGLTYSFLVHCPSNLIPHIVKEEYKFVITQDRNKEYHIFRQTFRASPQLPQCSNINTVHHAEPSDLPVSAPGSLSCSANSSRKDNLKIASSNIWNVNKLYHIGETYKSRMRAHRRDLQVKNARISKVQVTV